VGVPGDLRSVEAGVQPAGEQQFVVRPYVDDTAPEERSDPIRA